jgi:hypothetical protein
MGAARWLKDCRFIERKMTEPVWQFEHSIECNAPREFCWGYWTNMANWDDPPAGFHLEGPFADRSRITTELPRKMLHSVDSGCRGLL